MDILQRINMLDNLSTRIYQYMNYNWIRERMVSDIEKDMKSIVMSEFFKNEDDMIDKFIEFIDEWTAIKSTGEREEQDRINCIRKHQIEDVLKEKVAEYAKQGYSSISIDYESYKVKIIMTAQTDSYETNIVYLATSHLTDQEYRTFLANMQKGKKRIRFSPINKNNPSMYDLQTIKDGYISRVKKATNANTQDGYHADFIWNNDKFFLLREGDNPIDAVYQWIVENTQSGVLPEWKTYLYNTLVERGMITECEVQNLTDLEIKGIVLADAVDTDLIRDIKVEGIGIGAISIPRPPVDLDENMTFIEAMTKYIIPEINSRETLYTVGDEISKEISSPIIFKQGNKLKKTYLYPRQQVMAQGILNGIKNGRNSIILNGGMGIGKTYISIKLSNAILKDHFNRDTGRFSVYCQSHLLKKWKRQFEEALPDKKLKFYQIDSYKDVINLPGGKPDGIEVYLLPKDRVKRKYLQYHSATRKFDKSASYSKFISQLMGSLEGDNVYVANEIKASEMKLLARMITQRFKSWTVVAKEVLADDGSIKAYRVATTSSILKEKFGDKKGYYNFEIDTLDKIWDMKEELDKEEFEYVSSDPYQKQMFGLTCPTCGGPLYDSEHYQLSEDEFDTNLHANPKSKSDRNKKCTNYIKVDGTPLTQRERKLLIKGYLGYIVDDSIKTPYLINDQEITPEEINEIKAGEYDGQYTIVLKKCDTPLWAAKDQKGYRTANAIDMLDKRFGKGFFDCSVADEVHLYTATSNQGQAFSKLCQMSKVNLALTGTLTGGKASHLYYLLYRMIPHKMSKHFKYSESTKFIDFYGRRKKVTKEYGKNSTYNKSGVGKTSTSYSEIPGISPLLYSHFLSDIMVSRKIEDMGFDLPPLLYYKHEVDMDKDIKEGYEKLRDDIIAFMKDHKELNLGGTYLNTLLSYPDMPNIEPLMYDGWLISNPPKIDIANRILPKERKLLDTVKRELAQGRRMVVYVTYTGEKAIDKRVADVLNSQGIKTEVLKSSVPTEKREEWIEKKYKEGVMAIVCNPKLVQTGLDIVTYPSMYFYQLDYDVRVVRQAESRAWRVGQTKDCYVYYSYYNDSLQADALRLIGSKKKASLALEGVFAEDILSSSGDDVGDSGAAALYKSLLGKIKLKEDDLDFFSEEEIIEIDDVVDLPVENVAIEVETTKEKSQLSLFTITEEKIKKREKKKMVVGQVSLFEC